MEKRLHITSSTDCEYPEMVSADGFILSEGQANIEESMGIKPISTTKGSQSVGQPYVFIHKISLSMSSDSSVDVKSQKLSERL